MLQKIYLKNGSRLYNVKNFPCKREWVCKQCKICNGEMELYENAICVENCEHVYHEYCLYDYIVKKITNHNETIETLKCPREKCTNLLFNSN